MYSKGGFVGFVFDDFNYRERSGDWSIEDHLEDLNYIRTGDIPNNYLLFGTYSDQTLYLYNTYYRNKISTSIFNHLGTVTSIDYHFRRSLLAIGLTKPPYLRIFKTTDFTEITPTFSLSDYQESKPSVTCVKFSGTGKKLYVGLLRPINNTHVLEYETENFSLKPDLAPINYIPTKIASHLNDSYLVIGHYKDSNIKIFNNKYEPQSTYSLERLNISTILDLCFIETLSLLVIAANNFPYLIFYDYQNNNLISRYDEEINKYLVKNRVTSICKTSDNKKIILGCESSPFLLMLDLISSTISRLDLDQFNDSITSVSLSLNDEFLFVSQRNSSSYFFDFSNKDLSKPLDLMIKPNSTVFASTFLIGPTLQYVEILKPSCSISCDDLGVVAIDNEFKAKFTGVFYLDYINKTQTPDLAPFQDIYQIVIYKSLDYSSCITAIKFDGSIITNDPSILTSFPPDTNPLNNIIQVSAYYYRIAFLDFYRSIIIVPNRNAFSQSEVNLIKTYSSIKQISVGYRTLLALTNDGKVLSSNIDFFNPEDYELPEIIQVSAANNHVSLLTSNNTVLSYGLNDYNQCNTSSWTNVKQISTGDFHTAALTNDNKVLVTGPFPQPVINEIQSKNNIVYITSGPTCLILLDENRNLFFYKHSLSQTSSVIDVSTLNNIRT